MATKSTHIIRVQHRISLADRWRLNGHRSGVIWLTGLSGSGKTTLSLEMEARLVAAGQQAYVLDGDNIRHGVSADLGFLPEDRKENIRRIGEIAALFADAGSIVITAFISPYRTDREQARMAVERLLGKNSFHEVYLSASIEVCEARDPKGLYARARRGEIPDFTGVSAPYELPLAPELTLDSSRLRVNESADQLFDYIKSVFIKTQADSV